MSARDPELQRLLDLEAIRACLHRYSRGIDRHDEEIIASVYHPDAIDHHGSSYLTPREFGPWANELHESEWVAHNHFIATTNIDLDGDVAHSEAYVLFVLRRKDGDKVDLGGGRYIDRFERRDGEWRIAAREVVIDWFCQADGSAYGDVVDYAAGTWDRTDLSYRRPLTIEVPASVGS